MILIITATFPPEPVVAAGLAEDLAIALSRQSEVRVLSPKPSRPMGFSFCIRRYSCTDFEHIVVGSYVYSGSSLVCRFLESLSFGLHAVRYIRKNHQSIKCCYVSSWPLIGQYLIIRALRKYSVPSVTHVQDIYPESLSNKLFLFGKQVNSLLLPMDRYILNHSTRVIANSRSMKNTLSATRRIDESKIEIIHNWQKECKFLNPDGSGINTYAERIQKGTFVFMYLGNLGPVAGIDLIINAFALAAIGSSKLIIAGGGSVREECQDLARSLGQADIEFWDVPDGDVAVIQKIADVLLLPVRKGAAMSSVPSKLISYMFSQKPVIASVDWESDTASAVRESGCGWVVDPGNIEQLAEKMGEVAGCTCEYLTCMGKKGLKYALANYSAGINLPRLVSIINETLRN